MKTEWKWNLVALMALAFGMAFQALLTFVCLLYIYPRIMYTYELLNQPLPGMLDFSSRMTEIVVGDWLLLPLLILILAAWVLFEWRFKKEGKAYIRLAAFSAMSLAITLFSATVSLSALIPLAAHMTSRATLALNSAYRVRSAPMVGVKLDEADTLASELSDACDKGDWDAIRIAAHDLQVIASSFMCTGADDLAKMANTDRTAPAPDLQRLLNDLHDYGMAVSRYVRSENLSAVQENLTALEDSLATLREALGWKES
jgi:hypothetical protein